MSNRSVRSPKAYQGQPDGRVNLYNQTYIGFVKEVVDQTHMGRLKVWIPEISSSQYNVPDQDEKDQWITVSYCSPFAGATPVAGVNKDSQASADSQQSYGWWAVPPHPGNEVVVVFANGDPNRGIWTGCLYQQRMNQMVPAIGSSNVHEGASEAEDGKSPSVEYNKKDSTAANSDDPIRPRFEPLHKGLEAQGLYTDEQRGPASTSARRVIDAETSDGNPSSQATASHTYGWITPRGNTIHIDDNPENEFIRMRTRSGAQVLINETVGYIYMISKNGNSWFEISDEGINAFTTRSFNVRAMEGTNIHTEGNTTINSVGSTNMSGSTGAFQVTGDLDLVVPGSFRVSTAGGIHLNAMGDINLTSAGNTSLLSSGTLAIQGSGNVGVASNGQLFFNGSKIHSNGGAGPAPTTAEGATAPEPQEVADREVNQGAGYPESSTKTTAGVLPTHEPWDGHPRSETAPDTIPLNGSSGSAVGEEGPDQDPDNPDEAAGDSAPPAPADGKGWLIPASGVVGSQFGMRTHPISGRRKMHNGVDVSRNNNQPVYATKGGKVIHASRAGGAGLMVMIQHEGGFISQYMHLSSIAVRKDATIQQGTVVGRVGSTGGSTGPHLHFGLKANGRYVNPKRYIPEMGTRGTNLRGGAKSRGS